FFSTFAVHEPICIRKTRSNQSSSTHAVIVKTASVRKYSFVPIYDSRIDIKGKGSIIFIAKNGERRTLPDVYYIPDLRSNIKDELIIDESETEDEISSGIFQKIKSKQETIGLGRLESNDYIAVDTTMQCIFRPRNEKAVIKKAKFSPEVFRYNEKRKSSSKNEASLHELRLKHIQETISMNSNGHKSSIDQESYDKENAHGQSSETGFVTMKKARFREARDRRSMAKPNVGVLAECSRRK
ncbi:unnamed protein product, partial [Arabidopsis halleri]